MTTITYLEYYPHYRGLTTASRLDLDETLFGLLLAVAGDEDTLEEMLDGIEFYDLKNRGFTPAEKRLMEKLVRRKGDPAYALHELFDNAKSISRALHTKGVWVGEWEEGSYALCTKEHVAATERILWRL